MSCFFRVNFWLVFTKELFVMVWCFGLQRNIVSEVPPTISTAVKRVCMAVYKHKTIVDALRFFFAKLTSYINDAPRALMYPPLTKKNVLRASTRARLLRLYCTLWTMFMVFAGMLFVFVSMAQHPLHIKTEKNIKPLNCQPHIFLVSSGTVGLSFPDLQSKIGHLELHLIDTWSIGLFLLYWLFCFWQTLLTGQEMPMKKHCLGQSISWHLREDKSPLLL